MTGDYIEIAFTVPHPGSIQQDMLIAGLGEGGYESFLETETGFNAYIRAADFSERLLQEAISEVVAATSYEEGAGEEVANEGAAGEEDADEGLAREELAREDGAMLAFAYEVKLVESQNWNQIWESNFNPVVIGKKCRISASFHEPDPAFPLEIKIDPKMSFGTGHHETTWLLASCLLDLPLSGKKVLDMGCGTGVLAILAAKTGASNVLAVDIDPVCIESTLENAALNNVQPRCLLSDINTLSDTNFDLILANINRNILLEHIPFYAEKLNAEGGTLLISGFYEGADLEKLREKAKACGLRFMESRSKNRWAAAQFLKD